MEIWDRIELARRVSMLDAIEALDRAFGQDLPVAPARQHHAVGEGDLLIMPAWSDRGAGVKLVTVNPGNAERGAPLIGGIYVLFDPVTLSPRALIDAGALTALRTAAVSGVATKHLAAEDASSLVVFGSGVQAQEHVAAMRAVRPISTVVIVGRDIARAESLVRDLGSEDIEARVGSPSDVKDAHVICCCTTSPTPLFSGDSLRPGTHVNAVGSYKPDRRELDAATMRRAIVVVGSIESAMKEAGDVVMAIAEGMLDAANILDLKTIVRQPPETSGDLTVFKSVGAAYEDLVVALAAADRG
jgi:ornithine cyclodeaminase/alanine dehydrogenase-like protein (mu-crystallin family)